MSARSEKSAYETIVGQLRAAMDRWYRGEPSGYAALFADDVTYFAPVTDGRLEGIGNLRALFAPVKGKINIPRFELLSPKLQLQGDVGVLTYNLDEYARDGAPSARWNATEIYRRVGDQWRIIHGHWSARAPSQQPSP
jgi:ketosteroid isomerase-like protein